MARPKLRLDLDDLVGRFKRGESFCQIAVALGVSDGTVAARLKAAGYNARSYHDAALVADTGRTLKKYWSKLTTEERVALSEPARQAAYANRRLWSPEAIKKRAQTSAITAEQTRGKQGATDRWFASELRKRKVVFREQCAVGPYNLDFAIGSVAVEIHLMTNNPARAASKRKRTEYLLREKWAVVYLWLNRCTRVTPEAVNVVISTAQLLSANPSTRREYRVIRCDGQLVARGRLDRQEKALVIAFVPYRGGRWKTYRR
jgi:very-short-patch-repair endonuclease